MSWPTGLENLITNYFVKLFTMQDEFQSEEIVKYVPWKVSVKMNE